MSILLERHLTNEFLFKFSVVLSGIYIAAPTGVPPAADTDCRLAQPVTPETVYSPTLAGRRSKPRNLILFLGRAGFEPTTSSTAVQRLTTVPTRQAASYHCTNQASTVIITVYLYLLIFVITGLFWFPY